VAFRERTIVSCELSTENQNSNPIPTLTRKKGIKFENRNPEIRNLLVLAGKLERLKIKKLNSLPTRTRN